LSLNTVGNLTLQDSSPPSAWLDTPVLKCYPPKRPA